MPIKKKSKKKTKKTELEKFWVIKEEEEEIREGLFYSSFEEAKGNAGDCDIVYECVVTKTFVQKGWEEEK